MKKYLLIIASMVLFCTSSSFSQPVYVDFPLFQDFKANVNGKNVALKCDSCDAFSVNDGLLQAEGYGNLWTKDISYDLTKNKKVIVEAKTRLVEGASFMVGFSANLKGWATGGFDALTFRIGSTKDDSIFTLVRSGMYGSVQGGERFFVPPGKWQVIKIILTSEELSGYVEGVEVIRVNVSKAELPKKGHVGLLHFVDKLTEVEYMNIHNEDDGKTEKKEEGNAD